MLRKDVQYYLHNPGVLAEAYSSNNPNVMSIYSYYRCPDCKYYWHRDNDFVERYWDFFHLGHDRDVFINTFSLPENCRGGCICIEFAIWNFRKSARTTRERILGRCMHAMILRSRLLREHQHLCWRDVEEQFATLAYNINKIARENDLIFRLRAVVDGIKFQDYCNGVFDGMVYYHKFNYPDSPLPDTVALMAGTWFYYDGDLDPDYLYGADEYEGDEDAWNDDWDNSRRKTYATSPYIQCACFHPEVMG